MNFHNTLSLSLDTRPVGQWGLGSLSIFLTSYSPCMLVALVGTQRTADTLGVGSHCTVYP